MSTFAFRAVDVAGVPSRGEVEADTKGQVTEQLRDRGLIVLDVTEQSEQFKLEQIFDRFRGIKARDMAIFSRQFATMIDSVMPMLSARRPVARCVLRWRLCAIVSACQPRLPRRSAMNSSPPVR